MNDCMEAGGRTTQDAYMDTGGRVMQDAYRDIGGRAKQEARTEQLPRRSRGSIICPYRRPGETRIHAIHGIVSPELWQ